MSEFNPSPPPPTAYLEGSNLIAGQTQTKTRGPAERHMYRNVTVKSFTARLETHRHRHADVGHTGDGHRQTCIPAWQAGYMKMRRQKRERERARIIAVTDL